MISIADTARKYIGVRFKHRGRGRDGLDCAGLVLLSCKDAGQQVQDYINYNERPNQTVLIEQMSGRFDKIQVSEARRGDILIISIGSRVQHMAILCGLTIIHANSRAGRVVESAYSPAQKKYVIAAYRVKYEQ